LPSATQSTAGPAPLPGRGVAESLGPHPPRTLTPNWARSPQFNLAAVTEFDPLEAIVKTSIVSGLCLCLAALTSPAASQPQPPANYRYLLPLDIALDAAIEAVRVCTANGYQVTATVVDMDGIPQVAIRGDNATVHTRESSFQKAFTVVTLGPMFNFDTSGQFFELTKTNPYAPRLATVTNVMALPGAVAFKSRNAIVAALGVGGAPGGDKDEVCARAGVAKVAPRLPN
jgi:uncharacterized protein GlcG (DUF336 family)